MCERRHFKCKVQWPGPLKGPGKFWNNRSNLRLYPVNFGNKIMHFDFHHTFNLTKLFWPPLYYGKLFGPPPPSGNSKLFWPPSILTSPPHQSIYEHSLSSCAWTLTNCPRLNLAHACLDIHGLKYTDINTVYSAPPSTLLPLLKKSKVLQPEFQYACLCEELYHCQPWVNPMHCGLCCAEKFCRLGVVYYDECYTCRPRLPNPQPICNLTGESSAIHDCWSVADMPQIKKWGGGGWGTMFNQNWVKKEKCGIEN